jgi:hypothetical protein
MSTENNMSADFEQLKQQQRLLFRAVRISLGLLVITLGSVCIRSAITIPKMRVILQSFGIKFSGLIDFVMWHMDTLLLSALTLTLVGLGFLVLSKNAGRSIIVATITAIILFVQWQITITALQSPMINVFDHLGGDPQ